MALAAHARPAAALELFGIQLWGEKTADSGSAAAVPDPMPYVTTLSVVGDQAVDGTLRDASRLVAEQDIPPSGMVGLVTRARNDRKRLIAALYAQGYYGGTVAIRLNGDGLEEVRIDAAAPTAPVEVAVTVDTGPVFIFGRVEIGPLPPDARVVGEPALAPGAVARSGLILEAERRAVEAWREHGHPLAAAGRRDVQADHATHTLNVRIAIEQGPAARFGAVHVEGAGDVDPDLIVSRAGIPSGERFHPETLRTAEKGLQELNVFGSISVREGDRVAPDGTIPVIITVSERKPRTVGVGVTASNTEGFGTEVYWVHRNLFGGAEMLRLEGAIARIGETFEPVEMDYRAAVVFAKPEAFGPATRLTTKLEGQQENPDAFLRRAVSGEIFASRSFTRRITGRVGFESEVAHVRDSDGTENYLLVGVPAEMVYDSRDNPLDPTRGVAATVFTEPVHDIYGSTTFLTSKASIASYLALTGSNRIVLAGRVAAGSIVGADVGDIPASRRFYAGGGGSIRGYAYQAASPRNGDGDLVGGLSFVETSIEARVRVTDTVAIVPFFDIGGAFSSVAPGADGEWFYGAGIGLRYLTPVGPLRLDAAIPLNTISGEPEFGLYLGVGQAF